MGPGFPTTPPLPAPQQEDGRQDRPWTPEVGREGTEAAHPEEWPRDVSAQRPTGADFAPHSPSARRTMATVGPRRNASARRAGLQLPATPAACPPDLSQAAAMLAGHLGWQAKPGRAGRGHSPETLGGPAGSGWGGGLSRVRQAAGPQHFPKQRRRPEQSRAPPRGRPLVGRTGSWGRDGEQRGWAGSRLKLGGGMAGRITTLLGGGGRAGRA